MNTRIPFLVFLLVFTGLSANAGLFGSSESDVKLKKLEEEYKRCIDTNEWRKKKIEELEAENSELKDKLNRLQFEKEPDASESPSEHSAKSAWKRAWWLVAFATILIVVFRLVTRKKSLSGPIDAGNTLPKCPRCGQEHDPGDTICQNPACKTQF